MSATMVDSIYDALVARIVAGDLPAGEKLRQDHIAKEFGTSHVPVREALLRLEGHGLAQSQPRRGMRVTALDPEEVREVIQMRISLETLALSHSIPRLTARDLKDVDAARLACDQAETMAEWELKNRAFHRAILTPCAMPRLLRTIDDLHIASARHFHAHWRHKWVQRTDKEHAAILTAMQRRDAQAACELLRRHLKRVR